MNSYQMRGVSFMGRASVLEGDMHVSSWTTSVIHRAFTRHMASVHSGQLHTRRTEQNRTCKQMRAQSSHEGTERALAPPEGDGLISPVCTSGGTNVEGNWWDSRGTWETCNMAKLQPRGRAPRVRKHGEEVGLAAGGSRRVSGVSETRTQLLPVGSHWAARVSLCFALNLQSRVAWTAALAFTNWASSWFASRLFPVRDGEFFLFFNAIFLLLVAHSGTLCMGLMSSVTSCDWRSRSCLVAGWVERYRVAAVSSDSGANKGQGRECVVIFCFAFLRKLHPSEA